MTEQPIVPELKAYVIACGDEGVQINQGTRLSFAGAGYKLPGFSEAVAILKKILDKELRVVSCQENDWMKEQLDLQNWQQVNAMMQQHTAALADLEGLLYSGYLPFKDPKQLEHGVKGHMVRPHGVHVANKMCFTLGGGEQTYNLGQFQISADWVAQAPKKIVETCLRTQMDFYTKIAQRELKIVFEERGELGEAVVAKNKKMLESIGINASV